MGRRRVNYEYCRYCGLHHTVSFQPYLPSNKRYRGECNKCRNTRNRLETATKSIIHKNVPLIKYNYQMLRSLKPGFYQLAHEHSSNISVSYLVIYDDRIVLDNTYDSRGQRIWFDYNLDEVCKVLQQRNLRVTRDVKDYPIGIEEYRELYAYKGLLD